MADDELRGAAGPSTSASDWHSARFTAEQVVSEMSTATMVKIIKPPYDKNGNPIAPGTPGPIGYVDVQPLVSQMDGNEKPTKHGVIYRLKYMRYGGGYGAFISDPKKGDVGKMVVADTDTSLARESGDIANPGSARRFDKSDGTFFGAVVQKDNPKQYFAWKTKGFELKDENGRLIKGDDNGITIDGNGKAVVINGATITAAGDVVSKSGKSLSNHTHGGVTRGGANTDPPA
jgi:hypothetical protein